MQDIFQPQQVLGDQRFIQPKAMTNMLNIFRRHSWRNVRLNRITRGELYQQKRHQRDKEKHRQQLQQPTSQHCVHDIPFTKSPRRRGLIALIFGRFWINPGTYRPVLVPLPESRQSVYLPQRPRYCRQLGSRSCPSPPPAATAYRWRRASRCRFP